MPILMNQPWFFPVGSGLKNQLVFQAKKSGGELLSVNELHDTSPTKVWMNILGEKTPVVSIGKGDLNLALYGLSWWFFYSFFRIQINRGMTIYIIFRNF